MWSATTARVGLGERPSVASKVRGSEPTDYPLLLAVAEPGFGLAGALGTVAADATTFFLSALGFLASRLLLF